MNYSLVKNSSIIKTVDFNSQSPPTLPLNKGVWLPVIYETPPSYDPSLECLEEVQTITSEAHVISYTKRNKTAYELWHFKTYSKRIKGPLAMVMSDIGSKIVAWWVANDLKFATDFQYIYLYCNTILPDHQSLVTEYVGIITIEDIPQPS